jgi:hypothetical protein
MSRATWSRQTSTSKKPYSGRLTSSTRLSWTRRPCESARSSERGATRSREPLPHRTASSRRARGERTHGLRRDPRGGRAAHPRFGQGVSGELGSLARSGEGQSRRGEDSGPSCVTDEGAVEVVAPARAIERESLDPAHATAATTATQRQMTGRNALVRAGASARDACAEECLTN